MSMASPGHTVDILHPYAELKWRECRRLPVEMNDGKAVWLGDKLYVGGGWTPGSKRDEARLYIYTPTTDTWSHINTPVYRFALIIYQSQLVLVGGMEFVGEGRDGPVTKKLWTLTEHGQWRETLPPMRTKRRSASAVEFVGNVLVAGGRDDKESETNVVASAVEFAGNILVAGGRDDKESETNVVEVYNGHHWAEAQCLPKACYDMKSTVLNGHWYLMGGEGQGKDVCYASLDLLVASCQPSEKPLTSVWKRLPDVPHEYFSIAVSGNRLIAVGGEGFPSSSSSIHAYFPYNQSWVHVGNMPVELHSTCSAVLPTGELMVIGGWNGASPESCVHKANLNFNVSFDSDSHFTMEALSRLKQIGITSLRELDPYVRLLQSVVGVDLPIDNSSSLFEMWVQGRASLHPTWRHLFWALREIKLNRLADQIEAFLNGVAVEHAATFNLDVSPWSEEREGGEADNKQEQEIIIRAEEEKHIAAVQKAMEERGMLDHTILHGVFVGPARSGKNSLMERLLGRMPSSVSPSTGVAESVVQVKVIQKSATLAANVEELIWSVMDYDDEAIKLMLIHTGSQNEVEAPMLQAEGIVLDIFNSEASSSEDTRRNTNNVETITVVSESENKVYETQSSLPKDSVVIQSSSVVRPQLPNSYVPPTEIFKRALQKKGYEALKQHFEKTWSLNLTNTGGQMEFQEVLPLLVSGPSVFFFTFRLDRDLHEYYSIEYELSDGKKSYPYTSTLSTIDGMMQTLASISAMGTFVYSGLQRRDKALRPKVFFVGTHKDKLDSELADSHIARVDKELREVIGSTAYYKDLVEFASKSRLLFTVNNFSNSDSDFEHIRSAVQRVATRNDFQMTSPTHWLIFSLAIRKLNDRVISYDQCLEVARQCGLHADELDEALHFIHSKMGLIRYFPYEHINDLVFTDPQFLFDKVTELIVDTFTFEKTTKQAMDEFKKKGIFSLSEFEVISSRADSNMKPFQFAKLLERLRIAAPFEMDGNRMYFFPCVLAHTRMETPLYHLELLCSPVPNLIVTFKCGYCPKGLPGALVTYLLTNEMKSVYRWTLLHDEIFRNQVSFKVGPLDTVVFKIFSTYLEIIFNPKTFAGRDVRCPKERVCSNICQAVNAGIIRITSDINYVNAQHFFTFPCGCNSGHPGRLEVLDNEPFCLTCDKTNEQYPLPPGYELWQTNKAATDTTSTVAGVLSHSRDHSGEVHTQSHIESLSTSQLSQHCFADYLLTPLAHRKEAAQPEATVATPLEGLDELGGGTGISSASVTERPLPTCSYPSLSGAHTGYSSGPPPLCNTFQQKSTRLSDIHMSSLLQQLSVHAMKWREIGTYLGFRPGELDNICGHSLLISPTDWLREMLSQWLQWAPGDSRGSNSFATLEDLKTALYQARLGAAAHGLRV